METCGVLRNTFSISSKAETKHAIGEIKVLYEMERKFIQ